MKQWRAPVKHLTYEEIRERDNKVIRYINWYWERFGFPPSYASIGKAIEVNSKSTVHGIISRLERQRRIARDPLTRQIRIVNNGDRANCIHDWRVRKIGEGVITVICADCEFVTEAEYAPTPETPLKDLLKYTGGV